MKLEAVCSSEMSVYSEMNTQCNSLEDHYLKNRNNLFIQL